MTLYTIIRSGIPQSRNISLSISCISSIGLYLEYLCKLHFYRGHFPIPAIRSNMAEAEGMFESENKSSGENSSDSDFEGFEADDIRLIGNVQRFTAILNPDYDREVPKDMEMNWSTVDSPPTVAPFTRNTRLTVDLADDASPIDFFKLLFNEDYWEKIVTQTNLYANG